MCVCCTHLFSFFPLAFVLVNDLSLVSLCCFVLEMRTILFCSCCPLFLFVVCTCILCLLPCHTRCPFIDVLSCTPTGVSEINKPLVPTIVLDPHRCWFYACIAGFRAMRQLSGLMYCIIIFTIS